MSGTHLALIESVRCLECGAQYTRTEPGRRTTVDQSCPSCGYVGWIPVNVAAPPRLARRAAWRPRLVPPPR